MSFHINACLVDGIPRLELFDSQTGDCRLQWQYNPDSPDHDAGGAEVQRLFHQLILLTCQQETANVRVFWTAEQDGHMLGGCGEPGP